MVQNMRAYSILHIIRIKCINCMQEKTEFSCKLQRPTLISTKILGDLSLATKIKQQKTTIKNCKKILRGGKKMASCCPGGGSCRPTPPHSYRPEVPSLIRSNFVRSSYQPGKFQSLKISRSLQMLKNTGGRLIDDNLHLLLIPLSLSHKFPIIELPLHIIPRLPYVFYC